jgi:ABC-2 type transport system permease protein
MKAIFWKELADHFSSWRFFIFMIIILLASMFATYTASQTIMDSASDTESIFVRIFSASGDALPSFLWFITLLGPFLGIIFGFDVINGERMRGTLSRILSQPVFRDSVINGKFLAGLVAISVILAGIILMSCGLGLRALGIAPDLSEIIRIILFFFLSLLYVGFWLALGVLCSVLFKSTIVSVLMTIAVWIFFAIFMSMIAGVIADEAHPIDQYSSPDTFLAHDKLEKDVQRISPVYLFNEASDTILNPEKRTLRGLVRVSEVQSMVPGSVSVRQSLLLIWPHIVTLIALISICFVASYIKFMKEEIRAT